jgi:hypothetical protein
MKQKDFIVGKWYYTNSFNDNGEERNLSNSTYFAKCSNFVGDRMYAKEYFVANYNNIREYEFCKGYYWKEADMLEVSKYLPENHPDKVVGLPEEYIVDCKGKDVSREVAKFYYKDTDVNLHWNYIACTKLYDGKHANIRVDDLNESRFSTLVDLPIFTYETWTKLKDMKKELILPEKWVVAVKDNSTPDEVYQWRKSKDSYGSEWLYGGFVHSDTWYSNTIEKGYTEITLDAFKKYVLNAKDMEKKAVGYKSLFALPDVPKGTIGEILTNGDVIFKSVDSLNDTYYPQNYCNNKSEWFEPVYEEPTVILHFGDTEVKCIKGSGRVTISEGTLTKDELKKIIDHFMNGPKMLGYKGVAEEVIYGCKRGLVGELEQIYKTI